LNQTDPSPVGPELVDRGVENNESDVPEDAAGVSAISGSANDRAVKSITSSIVDKRPKNKFVGNGEY
jgi:hypothetical protein